MTSYEDQYEDDQYIDEEDTSITAEDCWTIIQSFFDVKGLVSQQLDSFDEFLQVTIQELIEENSLLTLDQHAPPSDDDEHPILLRRYEIRFGTIILSKPTMTEGDGSTSAMIPQEARLRNLTYSAPMYLEMTHKVSIAKEANEADLNEEEGAEGSAMIQRQAGGKTMKWEVEEDEQEPTSVFVGKMPIMLRAKSCVLSNRSDQDLHDLNECPYDQGGYFIINGSEKVLIAQ